MNKMVKSLLRLSLAIAIAGDVSGLCSSIALAADSTPTTGWQTYSSEAAGYSIQYPPGTQVATDPKTGQLNVVAASGGRMSVLPFFIAGKTLTDAPQVFATLAHVVSPSANWAPPVVQRANAIKSTASNANGKATAAAVFAQTPAGLAGQLCVTFIPTGIDSTTSDNFISMLASMKFASKPRLVGQSDMPMNVGSASAVTYHRWTDPLENAFFCEVPDGWSVDGGMKRISTIDTRPWVRIISPDKSTLVFLGDPDLHPGTIPTALLASTGYYIGRQYGNTTVEPYETAPKFINRYVKMRLSKLMSNMQLVQSQNHPDIDQAYNGNASMHSAGSAKFTGTLAGAPGVAYILTATKASILSNSGMWWVTLLGGVVTTAAHDQEALDVYLHVFKSVQYNPAWTKAADANAGEVSRAFTISSNIASQAIVDRYRTQQASSQAIVDGYWSRQATQDASAHNFSNYIRGTTDMQDPGSGKVYNVTYGPQAHWIDSGGTIYGGDNTVTPGADWRQLIAPAR